MDQKTLLANKLKADIQHDLVGSYESLLQFCEEYAPNTDLNHEAVLLGSNIFEYLDDGDTYDLEKEKELELKKLATLLVDRISDANVNKESLETTRQFFLDQVPENKLVFTGKNLSKWYKNGNFKLDNVSLDLKLGEITGIVGANGNGKTTLLKIIAGELRQSSGQLDYPMFYIHKTWEEVKRNIGFINQNIESLGSRETIRTHLKFSAAIKGIKGQENEAMVDFIINRMGLKKYERMTWGQLSGGFKLRVELARQIMWRPRLLILDEPLANLDVKAQEAILEDLRNLADSLKHPMSIVISSQNIHEVEKIADNIIFIRDGNALYNGPVENIGSTLSYRCFELESNLSAVELQRIFSSLKIREIRFSGAYCFVYTDQSVSSWDLLEALKTAGAPLSFFRDITNSTRLLFEE